MCVGGRGACIPATGKNLSTGAKIRIACVAPTSFSRPRAPTPKTTNQPFVTIQQLLTKHSTLGSPKPIPLSIGRAAVLGTPENPALGCPFGRPLCLTCPASAGYLPSPLRAPISLRSTPSSRSNNTKPSKRPNGVPRDIHPTSGFIVRSDQPPPAIRSAHRRAWRQRRPEAGQLDCVESSASGLAQPLGFPGEFVFQTVWCGGRSALAGGR